MFSRPYPQFKATAEKLCELCNLIAMIFLQKDKYDACLEFLKKGEILSQKSKKFKALTYNNLACFYRRTGKLRIALKYLERALAIEFKLPNQDSIADTHLNVCAVLSQLNRHEEALEHVLMSIVLLQDEFMQKKIRDRMLRDLKGGSKAGEPGAQAKIDELEAS